MPTDFHPAARLELDDAVNWYFQRSPQAAQQLALEVESSVQRVSADPLRFPVIGKDLRSSSVMRFPYSIIFRVDSDRIYVIAVAHAKRRPGYWKDRL